MQACAVTDLKVHNKDNCYQLSADQMQAIQESGVSVKLETGTNIIKIREGSLQSLTATPAEPSVLLWIYGGRIVNKSTNVEVAATWASLNGYGDALVMDVVAPATLCAFFLDSGAGTADKELTLSVVRI